MTTTRRQVYEYYPFVVVGVIIERDGKILLVQEAGGVEQGQWNQPAGWLDKGEDPVAGAKREAQEETGLQIEITDFLGIYSVVKPASTMYDGFSRHLIKLIFVGKVAGGEIKLDPEEIMDARFFTPEEIYDMTEGMIRDIHIKDQVRDYFAGKRYPLEMVHHRK